MLVPLVIWAGSATLPFTFTAGSLIKAADINANFQALRDAINSGGSGTRLKVIGIRGADGSRQDVPSLAGGSFTPMWDTSLGMSCVPSKVPDAGSRCVPVFIPGPFLDSACTQLVATQGLQSVGDILTFVGAEPKPEPALFAFDREKGLFYRLGAAMGPADYHRQLETDGGTTCFKYHYASDAQSYQLGAVEPPSTFAPLEIGLQ